MKRFLLLTVLTFAMTSQAADVCDPSQAKGGKLPSNCRTPSSTTGAAGCKADAEKLCSGFGANDGLAQCLNDHKSELSSTCQATMKPAATPKSK